MATARSNCRILGSTRRVSSPADPRTLTGRTGKEVPCENLRVSRPKSAPHMTTQWGGCPEKNPLPHSRFDPGFTDLRPDFSGQPRRQTRLRDCPPAHAAHPPHGAAWESRKAPCWPRSMVGVPPPPPRPHHVDHTTSTPGPKIHALFPRPNKSGKVRDAEFHAYMLGKDDILSGIPSSAPKAPGQSSRTPRIVGTGGLRVHHLAPPISRG